MLPAVLLIRLTPPQAGSGAAPDRTRFKRVLPEIRRDGKPPCSIRNPLLVHEELYARSIRAPFVKELEHVPLQSGGLQETFTAGTGPELCAVVRFAMLGGDIGLKCIAEMDDWQLLRDYAERGSETAFRALVGRHLNLVLSSALRQVNNPQLAEEISQAVFILLARKARSLRHGVVLAGWLFRTTRFVAARAIRAEQRRQRREQEAFEMQQLSTADDAWKRIAPALDEAVERLGETDRNAVLLRFFEDWSHQQVGAALGLSEEAARKRVNRALEKLRGFFAGRGFVVSATALASALAANAVKAAPIGLTNSIAAAAFTAGAAATALLPAIASETLAAWRWTKLKWAGGIGAVALI